MRRRNWVILGVCLLLLAGIGFVIYSICERKGVSAFDSSYYNPPPRTKTSHCAIAHALPDPKCTPGAVDRTATVERICSQLTKDVRRTTRAIDAETFASYGVSRSDGINRENDHLISLELGGADNDIANHFPQPYEDIKKLKRGLLSDDELGAHAKDMVENWFHYRLCDPVTKAPRPGARELLPILQRQIAVDWVSAYKEFLRRPRGHRL